MMMLLNAKERSLDEIVALGSVIYVQQWAWQGILTILRSFRVEAGLEFVRVWDMVECGMVEFKVVV